jgi:lactoylglutathione lyase
MAADVPDIRFDDPSVNFFVRDVERATQFYTDLLGFTETFRTPKEGVPVHVELRLGHFTLALTSVEAALADHGLVVNPSSPSAELVVWTDDIDAAYAALTEQGAKSLVAPHDFRQTHRVAWVADPEGNPIHLSSPAH